MKNMKKIVALLLATVMVMAMSISVFAAGTGSITIKNTAIGETYSIYKVLDATTNATGGIDYKAPIPEGLTDYLEATTITKDGKTYDVIGKKAGVEDADLFAALKTWADGQTATDSKVADANTVEFTNIAAGYYVVISSQGTTVMVDSATNPAAEIYEKNTTEIVNEGKTADGTSYSIGDTITYTAKFLTTNYTGTGENAKQVYKYEIADTLPEYLSNVNVTSIIVDADADAATTDDQTNVTAQFSGKKITLDWVDANGKSLYKNGAEIIVTYTATLTSTVNVNANNTNTISITPLDKDGKPSQEPLEDTAVITTYAAALKKTDGTKALAGAKFKFNGLTVTAGDEAGVYIVSAFDPESTTPGTEMSTDANGMLYIIGLGEDVTLTGIETVAPDGYNKLESTFTMPAQKLEEEVITTSGTRYYDEDGNLVSEQSETTTSKTVEKNLSDLDATGVEVVNNAGAELPSTGGIGTTLFYVAGSILVIGAAVLLISKKRMAR